MKGFEVEINPVSVCLDLNVDGAPGDQEGRRWQAASFVDKAQVFPWFYR
jgi:hypothetical protein